MTVRTFLAGVFEEACLKVFPRVYNLGYHGRMEEVRNELDGLREWGATVWIMQGRAAGREKGIWNVHDYADAHAIPFARKVARGAYDAAVEGNPRGLCVILQDSGCALMRAGLYDCYDAEDWPRLSANMMRPDLDLLAGALLLEGIRRGRDLDTAAERVRAHVRSGTSPDYEDGALLVAAAEQGRLDIAEALCEAGADMHLAMRAAYAEKDKVLSRLQNPVADYDAPMGRKALARKREVIEQLQAFRVMVCDGGRRVRRGMSGV